MWTIIGWLVIGALAGGIASLIMGTDARQGWLATIVVGLLGAVIGGWLYSALTGVNIAVGFDLMSLLVAIVGAVVLLAIYLAIAGRRLTRRGA